jgi:hypothetical protein
MPSRLCLCNNFNNSIFSLRAHTPIDRWQSQIKCEKYFFYVLFSFSLHP